MNAFDRVCVGSFSDARLARARRLSGGRLCTSMGPRAVAVARAGAWCGRIPRLGADCVQVPVRSGRVPLCDPVMVRAAHRAGLPLHVWTVDDEAGMDRLLDCGVDGVMTDRPALLRAVLERRGQWHG
jgi:glycerophosphoryl diester phosphodiesterase